MPAAFAALRRLAAPAAAALFAVSLFAAVEARADAHAEDRYEDYYYPPVTSEETFTRVIAAAPPANAEIRVNFVTSVTKAQLAAPENPRFAIFEKGGASDRLIMVALDDEVFRTIFRARAQLSQITSNMRGTEFFRQQNLHVAGTMFDMLQIMGFKSLVISDGVSWSHLVRFEPNG
ncbi:MAG: hypothetical protein AAGF90_07450 [Pseudomonadota bacterium]